MKIFLQAAAIAAVIFLSLNLTACGSSKSSTPSSSKESVTEHVEPVAEPLTEADFVVDGVTLGMSKADVDTKLGAGERGLIGEFTYGHLFIFFTADGKISYISFANDNIRTARKVSVGSTLAALERIYGTNYRRDEDNENTFVAVYALGNLELRFSVVKKTSKVNLISMCDTNLYVPPIPKSKTPAALTEADFVIGDLRFGMSKADVERKLGRATDILENDWYGFGKDFGLHFKNGNGADIIIVATKNFGTPRKIFAGSALADVEKAYGTNYQRNENNDAFSIGYMLGEKFLGFMVDRGTNRVTSILVAENINAFIPPPKKSKPAETPKPQPKPQPNVDNKAAAERVLSDFTAAFLNRDRAGMEGCSFYEPRNFGKEKGYEMLDAQISVLDMVNDVHRQTFGAGWEYTFEIFGMKKVNADTYEAEIVFILGSDTLRCSNIRVCNVDGRWLVDADSFVLSTSMNFTRAIYSGY